MAGRDRRCSKAGATITGYVALQHEFLDDSDSTEARLTELADQLASPPG